MLAAGETGGEESGNLPQSPPKAADIDQSDTHLVAHLVMEKHRQERVDSLPPLPRFYFFLWHRITMQRNTNLRKLVHGIGNLSQLIIVNV